MLQLEFTGRDGNRDFAGLGEVITRTDTGVQLRVPRDEVAAVCRRLFEAYPVKDISVAEVPIEEVIAQLFAGHEGAAPTAEAAVTSRRLRRLWRPLGPGCPCRR